MKKSLLVIALLVTGTIPSFADYIRITKHGGPSGYNHTREKIDRHGNISIICSGPGYERCPVHVPKKPIEKELLEYAMAAIASGQLKGSYTKEGEKVIWKSDNTAMTNSKIRIR